MSLQDGTLADDFAANLFCPDCGHDVQPSDTYREVAHSIGEVYLHPLCPECNHYNDAHNVKQTDWWQPER